MRYKMILGFALLMVLAASAVGAEITIDTYDILHAQISGFGGWSHAYSGTITPEGGEDYTYAGGSGTMNDGVVGVSAQDTQLFYALAGPVITLHLPGTYAVNSIMLYGGTNASNGIPGVLTGMTVTMNGISVALTSTPLNPFCSGAGYCDDLFTLTGTALEGVTADSIAMSSVAAPGSYFSITEITLDGASASAIPEPGTMALLGLGLSSLVLLRRRR